MFSKELKTKFMTAAALLLLQASCFAVTRAGTSIESQGFMTFSGITVTSETLYTTVSAIYGHELSLITSEVPVPGGESFYFPLSLVNSGNLSALFDVAASATPEGWSSRLYVDDNRNDVHEDNETTILPSPVLLAEDAELKFFIELDAPDPALVGTKGYGTFICSSEVQDGPSYFGGNGILYGGNDSVEATVVASIETLGNARIWRDDLNGKILLTWGGGPGDVRYRTDFGLTFEGAAAEATNVSPPFTSEAVYPKDGSIRFYRVAVPGTTSFAPGLLGKFDTPVSVGINELSTPVVPFDTSISSVVGTQVTGANNSFDADRVWKYNPLVQSGYDIAWLVDDAGPPYDGQWYTGNYPTTLLIEADEGFVLQIRDGHPATYITFVGRVSEVDRDMDLAVGMNFVGTCFPVTVPLGDQASSGDSNLWESGATGSNNSFDADRVWKYNPLVQSQYDTAWLVDGVNPTYNGLWYTGNYPTTMQLEPGKGYRIQVRDGHSPFTWHYPRPY